MHRNNYIHLFLTVVSSYVKLKIIFIENFEYPQPHSPALKKLLAELLLQPSYFKTFRLAVRFDRFIRARLLRRWRSDSLERDHSICGAHDREVVQQVRVPGHRPGADIAGCAAGGLPTYNTE